MLNSSRQIYISKLLVLASLVFVLLNALPLLPESFFPIDDRDLVDIPQIETPSLKKAVTAAFTMGTHIDYYPIRDLSYWLDVHLLGANIHGDIGTTFRVVNFILFALSALLLVSLFEALGFDSLTSAIATSIWIILPNHFEIIWWISSRKDLLAMFFSLLSFRLFLCHLKSPSILTGLFCLFIFALGLLSKVSFCLLPITGLIGSIYLPKLRKPSSLLVLVVAGLMGFAWIAIQQHFYSTYNDMRFWYPFSYRYRGAIEALGRMAIGVVWAPVNSIDVFNWGDWVERNQGYFWPGILLISVFSALFLFSIIKKWFYLWIPCVGCLFFYLPVSALFFPHRNFYSVRYFEPPLLAAVFTLPFFLIRTKRFKKKAYLPILLVCLFLTLQGLHQGTKLTSCLAIFSKALALDPTNPSLLSMKLQILSDLNYSGQTTPTQDEEMKQIETQLKELCDPLLTASLAPTGHLCSVFYGLEQKLTKDLLYIRKLSKAFAEQSILMGAGTKEFYLLKLSIFREFYYPVGNINELTAKFERDPFASVREHGRTLVVLAYCLGGQIEKSHRLYLKGLKQGLIRKETLDAQITSTISSALKNHLPTQRYQVFRTCLGPNSALLHNQ